MDGRGRDKEVRYYRMERDGEPVARNEVDEVRWAPLSEAVELLSYPHDRDLIESIR